MVKNLPAMRETWVQSLGWEDPLEEGMAIHSSITAWRIPLDRGAWRTTIHGVTESDATEWLSTSQAQSEWIAYIHRICLYKSPLPHPRSTMIYWESVSSAQGSRLDCDKKSVNFSFLVCPHSPSSTTEVIPAFTPQEFPPSSGHLVWRLCDAAVILGLAVEFWSHPKSASTKCWMKALWWQLASSPSASRWTLSTCILLAVIRRSSCGPEAEKTGITQLPLECSEVLGMGRSKKEAFPLLSLKIE